jgi:glutathione synthase/RimK-type ligase-like ATP-grasp enzyme
MPVYQSFIELAKTAGIEVRIAFTQDYIGASTFSHSYSFRDNTFTLDNTPYTADVILIRGATLIPKLDGSENIVNPLSIFMSEDKAVTYSLFSRFMAKTVALNPNSWQEQLATIPGTWVVCKPVDGWGGTGIWIGPKSDFSLPQDSASRNYILQEFIDTSQGVPNLVTGVHDLRIIVSGDYEPLSYTRSPKSGSLLANLSQGGSAIALERGQIPEDALAIAQVIERQLVPDSPHFICIDFLYGATGKVYLCEISSRPGFSYPAGEGQPFVTRFQATLLSVLKDALALQS